MITASKIYWLLVLGNVSDLLVIVFAVSIVATIINSIWFSVSRVGDWCDEEQQKRSIKLSGKILRVVVYVTLFSGISSIFVPDIDSLKYMYIIPALANNKLAKNLPDYANEFIKLELDKMKKQEKKS